MHRVCTKFYSGSHDGVMRIYDEYLLALEALETVARANEAVAEQIFKALETLHTAQEHYNMTLKKLENPIS